MTILVLSTAQQQELEPGLSTFKYHIVREEEL